MSNSSTINVDIVVNDKRAVAAVRTFGKEVATAGNTGAKSMTSLQTKSQSAGVTLGSLIQPAAFAATAFFGIQAAAQAIFDTFSRGLSTIEEFNLSVASSSAFIATFSDRTKSGDLAGGFQEANIYAQALNEKLEKVDSLTIASGKDLRVMSETMLQNGVILDINNQKQITGFTNIATALALVTQGQNKDIQMRQEINALLQGQVHATDRLPKLLEAVDPHLQEHLKLWKAEGTLIENVGGLLKGFSADTGELDNSWATVGSTMETIHDRILRGMFQPAYDDLIRLAQEYNTTLADANGELSPLSIGLTEMFNDGYEAGKGFFDSTDEGFIKMVAKMNLVTWGFRGVKEVAGLALGFIGDYGKTEIQKIEGEIKILESQLAGSKSWYQFSLFKDPAEEKRHIAEVNAEIVRLNGTLREMKIAQNHADAGDNYKSPLIDVPKITPGGTQGSQIDLQKEQTELLKQQKKETDELKKTELEMYQEAGFGADAYFNQQASALVEKAGKWKKAGADVYGVEQWLYEQMGKLSTDAYAKQEFGAGQTMDTMQAMSGAIVEQFGQANSSITGVLDSMGIKIAGLNESEILIKVGYDGDAAIDGIQHTIKLLHDLQSASASSAADKLQAKLDNSTQNTDPYGAAARLAESVGSSKTTSSSGAGSDQISAALRELGTSSASDAADKMDSKYGNSTVNVNVNQQVSRSDVTSIAAELKRASERG